MRDGQVTVARDALLRSWAASDHVELWMQFESDAPDADVTEAVSVAVQTANERFDDLDPVNDASGRFAYCEGPWRMPPTPRVYALYMTRCGTEDGVVGWLEVFAASLDAAGVRGRLVPSSVDDRAWETVNAIDAPQLATFFAYRVVDPSPPPGLPDPWNVDDDATRSIAEQVELAAFPDAEVFLRAGRMVRTTAQAAATALRTVLTRDGLASVSYIRPTPARAVCIGFLANGLASRMIHDPAQSWRDRLDQCIAAMTATPGLVDVAFVQHTRGTTNSWGGLDVGTPRLPGTRSGTFANHRSLLTRFLPDARGAQVMTTTHLERTHDLGAWDVDPLGEDRYLVQARNLADWYAGDGPSPEVLETARADFGAVILTPEEVPRHRG